MLCFWKQDHGLQGRGGLGRSGSQRGVEENGFHLTQEDPTSPPSLSTALGALF